MSVATQQTEPQRLLFVFTRSELPEDSNVTEQQSYRAGQGGNLIPVICVDKTLDECSDFAELVEESKKTGEDWHIVFVAALFGNAGVFPSSADAEQPLTRMIEFIQQGKISGYIAFDRDGEFIEFI
jgi:hypothetical protein